MTFAQLFSFEGRQRRLYFWLVTLVIAVINGVVWGLTIGPAYMVAATTGAPAGILAGSALLGWLVYLLLLWPSLANSVKRCHDRDKSGWWLLLMWLASITVIGALWPLIELGFIDGTPGPNRFGPSPKGMTATAAP
jgi:uncharacterized membrane protein YhaH (DUF805 family)